MSIWVLLLILYAVSIIGVGAYFLSLPILLSIIAYRYGYEMTEKKLSLLQMICYTFIPIINSIAAVGLWLLVPEIIKDTEEYFEQLNKKKEDSS